MSLSPECTDRDLAAIARMVYETSGITLHAGKRALVSARLQKRLRQTGAASFRDYIKVLQRDVSGEELTAMLDAITTNHTSFFREPQHFDFLAQTVLPTLCDRANGKPILGWSAACSTGEEAYTVAITACQALSDAASRRVTLLASDISSRAVARAAAGLFRSERTADMPRHLVLKYFQKASSPQSGVLQVTPSVRQMIEFRRLNLLHPAPPGPPFDFIFCRNVMIYFDRAAQQRVIDSLEARLARGGYLFISHSESLNGVRHGLSWVAPAIYRRGAA
ncbi:MAG: protein-glutamate O-methyltransferase CheR [Cyanobacteria bacterium]|nr:protein-glutamate O-methyltransferase CheR [Cyanobacteriota bacterium]